MYRHLVSDASGQLYIPFWIVLMAHAAIATGTLFGGWRIVHTVGSRITKLRTIGGFAAELSGAITIFTSSIMGVPVSTTHVITGAIVGDGSIRNKRSVRWGIAGRIVWAWVITIPAAGGIAALLYGAIVLIKNLMG